MKNSIYLIVGLLITTMLSCKNAEKSRSTTSAYLNFEVQYIKQESYGVDCYKIFVSGDSKKEGIKQAKLNLIKTVLFTGVQTAPNPRPLVPEVNALEKYRSYFNSFLSEDGGYNDFVSLYNGGKTDENDRFKTGDRKIRGVELLVFTMKLKEKMELDKIIKK